MRTTAADVARLADVSISTVSRALGTPHLVAPTTRQRVEQAAVELGYRPNRSAQHLVTGRTGNIGLIVPDLENPHFSSLAKGIQASARSHHYGVFIVDTDEDPHQEIESLSVLARQVDGVILCSARSGDDALRHGANKTNLVLVNRVIEGIPSVAADQTGGSREVIRHLLALGHQHVAAVGGPALSWTSRQRLQGLHAAGEELGMTQIHDMGAFRPVYSGGVAAADLILATPATAVIVHNDLMALGMLQRLAERGVSVPRDLSVVSYDDILLAANSSPSLTTVRSSPLATARAATALLNSLIAGTGSRTAPPSNQTLAMDLQVRGSTGPVRAQPHATRAGG